MTDIAAAIQQIRNVAQGSGALAELARESGVPYSTVHSFAQRDWTHKNLEVIEKLAAAAQRIAAKTDRAA